MPTLKTNNTLIKRVDHIKFLGVLFDENITWKNDINLIENQISKSLGILHRAKFLLNKKSKKNNYFSFIHCLGKYVQNQIEENIHLSEKKQLEQYFLLTVLLMSNH